MISAVVLAAGTSSRMGKENKLLLPFRGESILRHVVSTLKKADIKRIVVVLGHEAEIVKRHVADLGVETIVNHRYENGMCTSFQEGVRALEGKFLEGILLCLGDQPLVNEQSIRQLVKAFKADQTATKVFIVSHGGKKGHPVIFHPDTIADILNIPINGTIREVVHRYQTEYTKIETDDGVIKDVDTKDDYLRYCR